MVCTMKNVAVSVEWIAVVLLACVPSWGIVSIRERGLWPADWPPALEPFRDQARTFEVNTDVLENVYEITLRTPEELSQIWPAILQLKSDGAPLRVSSVRTRDDKSEGLSANDRPAIRIYTPAQDSSAQRVGNGMLPVGPPGLDSVGAADGSLPEYVVVSSDGMTWVPAVGDAARGLKRRARVEIELVADDKIVDFRRVLVPPETPILDQRRIEEERNQAAWYVSPWGKAGNPGTPDAPWDLASALNGKQPVRPGDTVYLLEGVYRRRPQELFEVRLQGNAVKPIQIRPAPRQTVRIDGGLSIHSPSSHVHIRDLEIFVSEPLPAVSLNAGSRSRDAGRPHGGLHMFGGTHCKYLNLVIHHCSQGVSCWEEELNPEIYGCVIYANGWKGVDGGHGHGICTQNDEGVKTISNCIIICPLADRCAIYAHGPTQACVNNYLLTENICYGRGPLLIGGGRPSKGIRASTNWLYGIGMKIGYNAPYNEDCEIHGNIVVNGRIETLRYRDAIWQENLVLPTSETPRTEYSKSLLLPNRYDRNRAHLAILNWAGLGLITVETRGFMTDGDTAELFDPENLSGLPVLSAVCQGGTIRVPVRGEFSAFVVKVNRR